MTNIETEPWQNLSIENRRAQILAEVEKVREADGLDLLNNFYRLFIDNEPGYLIFVRSQAQFYGFLDQKIGDHQASIKITQDEAQASSLIWHQTYRQFFLTLDQIAEELEIPTDIVKDLIHQELQDKTTLEEMLNSSHGYTSQIDLIDRIHEILLPVYIELRIMGYTYNDLCV